MGELPTYVCTYSRVSVSLGTLTVASETVAQVDGLDIHNGVVRYSMLHERVMERQFHCRFSLPGSTV